MAKIDTSIPFCESPQPSCTLMPAEQLGEHASLRHGNKNIYTTPLGDAWYYAELAIAFRDRAYFAKARHLTKSALGQGLPKDRAVQAQLLSKYLPAIASRVDGSLPSSSVLEHCRRPTGVLLSDYIDEKGYPKDPDLSGRVTEILALGLIPAGMPGSPREEISPLGPYNHDCYSLTRRGKVPASVKSRRTRGIRIDRTVYPLYLGPYLEHMLQHSEYQELRDSNERLASQDEKQRQEAAIAIGALAFAQWSNDRATPIQKKLLTHIRNNLDVNFKKYPVQRV